MLRLAGLEEMSQEVENKKYIFLFDLISDFITFIGNILLTNFFTEELYAKQKQVADLCGFFPDGIWNNGTSQGNG